MEDKVICNMCGKELLFENEIPKEDFVYIKKNWGYFSKRDGETHEIVICEDCYEKWMQQLKVQVKVYKTIEMI